MPDQAVTKGAIKKEKKNAKALENIVAASNSIAPLIEIPNV